MDIVSIIDYIGGLVWGLPAIIILAGTGLAIGILGGFYQIRKFGTAVKTMLYKGRVEEAKSNPSPSGPQ